MSDVGLRPIFLFPYSSSRVLRPSTSLFYTIRSSHNLSSLPCLLSRNLSCFLFFSLFCLLGRTGATFSPTLNAKTVLRNFDILQFFVLIGILRHLEMSPKNIFVIKPNLGRLNRNRKCLVLKFDVFSQYFFHFRKYAKMPKICLSRLGKRIFLTCVLRKSESSSLRSGGHLFFAFLQIPARFSHYRQTTHPVRCVIKLRSF